MQKQSYTRQFETYDLAFDFMAMKNKACERAGNKNEIYCTVPGCEGDNYAVVDLKTAIELGLGYVWAFGGYVTNPWTKNETKNSII